MVASVFFLVFGSAPAPKKGKVSIRITPGKYQDFKATWKTLGLPNNTSCGFFYNCPIETEYKDETYILQVWGVKDAPLKACIGFVGGVLADDKTSDDSSFEAKWLYGEKAALYTRIHRAIR